MYESTHTTDNNAQSHILERVHIHNDNSEKSKRKEKREKNASKKVFYDKAKTSAIVQMPAMKNFLGFIFIFMFMQQTKICCGILCICLVDFLLFRIQLFAISNFVCVMLVGSVMLVGVAKKRRTRTQSHLSNENIHFYIKTEMWIRIHCIRIKKRPKPFIISWFRHPTNNTTNAEHWT